jgi:hypothetical protein
MELKLSFRRVFFTLISLVLFFFAFKNGYENVSIVVSGRSTVGTVTEVRERARAKASRRANKTYQPVVAYVVDGHDYSVAAYVSRSSTSYRVGDRVKVFYDPKNPNRARMNDFIELFIVPFALVVAGCISGIATSGTFRGRTYSSSVPPRVLPPPYRPLT